MPPSYFPLRWESTGDQWWYASPIDWAAANGHYDLVRELLHIDPNLLIKLTSLRRIRRLESVWDDDARFADVARCRSSVARSLLLECEIRNGKNTLIGAGYGGWLLYTAASAGDTEFVQELLQRDPLMVFGEGEFGVTDILYAAARSKNSEVFRLLYDSSMSTRCSSGVACSPNDAEKADNFMIFRWEMLNRAVHAAARGGNLDILRELLKGCSDILEYRDAQGSTILHAASGRGQVEVVKDLVASFHIISSIDNQGNTSLHVAAFRGHLAVVEALVMASPSSVFVANNMGDTFLHLAVAGFRTSGFRRLDRQIELMRQLVTGSIVNIEEIINIRNNEGRTVLHMAVIGNVHSHLVNILMKVRSINLNICDMEGMTPFDLLSQRPHSASSDILIKQFISSGGISNSRDCLTRSAIVSQIKLQGGIGASPGTSFKVSDAEILLYTGIEPTDIIVEKGSGKLSSSSCMSRSDVTEGDIVQRSGASTHKKRQSPVKDAVYRLMSLLHWPPRKEKKSSGSLKISGDDKSTESSKKWSDPEDTPTPFRQIFSKATSLLNNKRTLSVRNAAPSPSSKKKFSSGLMHGVIQAVPHLAPSSRSPSSPGSIASPTLYKRRGLCCEIESIDAACPSSSASSVNVGSTDNSSQKSSSVNSKLMNQYFCFGAQGLNVEESSAEQRSKRFFKSSILSAT